MKSGSPSSRSRRGRPLMLLDARKNGPPVLGSDRTGTADDQGDCTSCFSNIQAPNPNSRLPWWSPELQRALDILAAPIYHGLQIQIMAQAGSGHHPPTSDPAELERFAREVGLDASYSIVTGNGRVMWPILIDLSPSNGDSNSPERATQGRAARRIAVVKRSR